MRQQHPWLFMLPCFTSAYIQMLDIFCLKQAGTALSMSSTVQNTGSMATLAGGTMPAALLTKKIQKTQKTSVLLFVLFCNQITGTCSVGQAVSAA